MLKNAIKEALSQVWSEVKKDFRENVVSAFLELKTKRDTPPPYNIAIIGQTGVGKSSLINYLFGEKVAETGIGRPVTANGFYEINHIIKDMPVSIFDSWGLEVGKAEQWQQELKEELKKRGIDKEATEWFHSVFYCISASSARVQDADIEIIKSLLDFKYKVSVILTKADTINTEDEAKLKEAIWQRLSSELPIISVCSESKKLRNQQESTVFGKEDVEKQSVLDLIDSLVLRIPPHCESLMKKKLKTWQFDMERMIHQSIGEMGVNSKDVQNTLTESSARLITELSNTGRQAQKTSLAHYSFIAKHLMLQMKSSNNRSRSDLNIYFENEAEVEWYLKPFVMLYNIFKGKDNAIKKTTQEMNNFVLKVEQQIDEQVEEMTKSFEAIRAKVKKDFE
jgi:GTP-binding protein EngB required for normal cell division